MTKFCRELEAKFHVHDLQAVRQRLSQFGAQLLAPRQLERNWYFDTSDRRLRQEKQVLRIRVDGRVTLTHKQQHEIFEDRSEIEVIIDDAVSTRSLLEGLGFEMVLTYEKFREVFAFKGLRVMLDEMPFGDFVEIEGSSVISLQESAAALDLDWERRATLSYQSLFETLQERWKLPFQEATFEHFKRLPPEIREKFGLLLAGSRAAASRIGS